MPDLVSVILPVYNGAKYLPSAIDSVLAQSHQELELIIVDDCSTDDSASIVEDYSGRDARIKFERNKANRGLFSNYNYCMELSKGDYIKPFAQDDILKPDCLKRAVEALKNNPGVALVTSGRNLIDGDGKVLQDIVPFSREGIYQSKLLITWSLITFANFLGEPVVGLFRARDKGTGFDPRYFHFGDLELWIRLLQQGDLYFIPEVLCQFRRHDGATTRHNHHNMKDLLDVIKLGHQYFSYLEEIGESREHFHLRVVEFAAMQVDHLVRTEGMTEAAVRKHGEGGGPGTAVNLEDDYAEAFYFALRYISPALAELDHLKRCRANDHNNFDAEIKKIHSSISWKVTAPLRALRSGAASESKDLHRSNN